MLEYGEYWQLRNDIERQVDLMQAFSMTDIGRHRKMNQDYVYISQRPVGNLPNLFIVADGMGGHNAGEYASRHTVNTIVSSAAINPAGGARQVDVGHGDDCRGGCCF